MSDQEKFVIEKDIPIPDDLPQRGRYPFGDMNVGDSLFIPGKTSTQVQSSVGAWRKKGWKFTCRAVSIKGVDGVRIWRIQ